MRKFVSLVLVVSILSMYCSPAVFAQDFAEPAKEKEAETPPPPADLSGSWVHCHAKGKADAQERGTGGSFVGGFAGGLLLGLIGAGVVVLAQSKSDPPADFMLQLEEEEEACRYTYIESYRNESVSKKRKSALTGGLIGTAIIVAVILSSNGE